MYTITGHMGCILDCTTFGSVCQATKNTSAKIQTSQPLETLFTNSDTIGIPQTSTLTDKLFSFEYVFVLFTYQTGRLCVPSNGITVQLSSSMWDISEAQLELPVVKV